MIRIALGAAAVLGVMVGEAHAEFQTGNDLYRLCASVGDFHKGMCLGFIEGVADTMTSIRTGQGQRSCIPREVEADQMREVVVKYLTEHPEDRNYSAASNALVAIAKAWPC
jgi:hypothetical protein